MGKGQERSSRHPAQIVEPTDEEKAAAEAARTFGRSFLHDSAALGTLAFVGFFFLVAAIDIGVLINGVARGEYGGQDATWLVVIGASAFVVSVVLAVVSVLVARSHHLHPGKSDIFAAGGHLFHTSFMRDKKYKDGRGIVRMRVRMTCGRSASTKVCIVNGTGPSGTVIHALTASSAIQTPQRATWRLDMGLPRGLAPSHTTRTSVDERVRKVVWWSWSGSSRHAVRRRKRTARGIPKKPLETRLKSGNIWANKHFVWIPDKKL